MINLYQGDCMEAMAKMKDNEYDLAIVDPPYGIGISNNPVRQKQDKKGWDNKTPNKEYFTELKRVSKNQIIWGGNYFLNWLNSSRCFIIWDKKQPEKFSLAMCEMAWTSFDANAKIYRRSIHAEQGKIHPTQKPVKLYEWLLMNYAQPNDKILDTHGGSMSIALACHNLGFDLDLWELDEDYHKAGTKRYNNHILQQKLF